jgi:hypothetical protein
MKSKVKRLLYFILVIPLVLSAGCVQRKMRVKSDPPGAQVYFNDKYMGETPLDFDFEWYWQHRIKIKKEGYETVSNLEEIKAPVYMWIPLDLVMELLPFTIRDERELTYTLNPHEESTQEDDEVFLEEIDLK